LEHSSMTAHIRLAASEGEELIDEAPVGLPEEASSDKSRPEQSRRDEMLGEAAPPLVAEPEDRAGGRANGSERPKKGALARVLAFARGGKAKGKGAPAIPGVGSAEAEGKPETDLGKRGDKDLGADTIVAPATAPAAVASADGADGAGERARPKGGLGRLLGFAGPRKARGAAALAEAGAAKAEARSEAAVGKPGNEDAGADTIVARAADGLAGADVGEAGVASGEPATPVAKPRRPLFASKGAIAVVLLTGVGAVAIMILNWPHPKRPPQVVEPGMLADQQPKLMAPSAELAKVPPREGANASDERVQVRETRGDEVNEVLSFKGVEATASPPASSTHPTPSSPLGGSVSLAKPAVPAPAPPPAAVPPDPPAPAAATLTDSAPKSPPAAASATDSKPATVASLPPAPSAPAFVPPLAPVQEPGLGEAAKIESRLGELEAKLKERSNAVVTRADIDRSETQTSDQITQLAAIVKRLTGQVNELQGQVQTASASSEAKLADLTRRVSMSESKSAVAAAERANGSPVGDGSAASASTGGEGQAQSARSKVAGADQKRNYRIQAASPGLAMLSAIDGGADDRPVEVVPGTDLPGYGKVRSIEQHGQAWVVKADRGEIE
jgi:hypothetical protein